MSILASSEGHKINSNLVDDLSKFILFEKSDLLNIPITEVDIGLLRQAVNELKKICKAFKEVFL